MENTNLITTAMPRERRHAMMATRRKAQIANRSDGKPGLWQAPDIARWLWPRQDKANCTAARPLIKARADRWQGEVSNIKQVERQRSNGRGGAGASGSG